MPSRSPAGRAGVVGAALALALAARGLLADGLHGRELALGEAVTTYVAPAGDTDDFVFDAAAGWKVGATVKLVRDPVLDPDGAWNLAPTLELIGPDGDVLGTGVTVKAGKKSAKLAAVLAEHGRHAIRVKGVSGTGGCVLTWTLAPAKVAPPLKNSVLLADSTTLIPFPARPGALVSWKFKYKGDGDADIAAVRDPDGADAGYDPEDDTYVKRTLTSEAVKDFPLPAGRAGGAWSLVLENRLAPSTGSLSISVKLPKVVKTSSRLTLVEPVLTGLSHGTSTCGVPVTLTGTDLGTDPRGVLFGTQYASAVSVTDGTTVGCRVPGGTGTVDVVYEAADGQQAVLPDAFTFKPLPTLTSFDPTVGPGVGRIEMNLYGSGFETEAQGLYDVLVGGIPSTQVQVLSPTQIRCVIPANVSGPQAVVLRNQCGEGVQAPGFFNYSGQLFVSSVNPSAIPIFGGLPVTVFGAGFNGTDTVILDGNPVATTPILYSGTVIGHLIAGAQVPAHAAGAVDIEVHAAGGQQAVKVNALSYYTFADVTATAIPAATTSEDWGGVSTVVADADGNGTVDWMAIADPAALSPSRPGTRILVNNGSGVFTDGTATRMPTPDNDTDYGANRLLAAKLNNDTWPDLFLSRPGTGAMTRRTSDSKFIDAWARMLLGDAAGGMNNQTWKGATSKFSMPGTLTYAQCYVYDFDFRSRNAALGDLDGDLDQDVLLVNDTSIQWWEGTGCTTKWITCAGGYYTACYGVSLHTFGSATRLCTSGSSGSLFDRTSTMLAATASTTDDFRAATAAIGDMTGDFLNDFAITQNSATLGPSPGTNLAATRVFKQQSAGNSVFFTKISNFLPAVTAGSDDWRGDAVALPDLNTDLLRDLVVGLDADLPNGGALSTRILVQDPTTSLLVDRTSTVLGGKLPAGDKGHAKFILSTDIDGDGDPDLFLSTPGSAGAGNRRTRFLLNAGKDGNGLPVLVDASSLFPAEASEPGNAVCLAVGDVNGDRIPDLVLTDTHQAGVAVKRTRIFQQVR